MAFGEQVKMQIFRTGNIPYYGIERSFSMRDLQQIKQDFDQQRKASGNQYGVPLYKDHPRQHNRPDKFKRYGKIVGLEIGGEKLYAYALVSLEARMMGLGRGISAGLAKGANGKWHLDHVALVERPRIKDLEPMTNDYHEIINEDALTKLFGDTQSENPSSSELHQKILAHQDLFKVDYETAFNAVIRESAHEQYWSNQP